MSRDIDTVERYLDGRRASDHEKLLSCLADDVRRTVLGGGQLHGETMRTAMAETWIPRDGLTCGRRSYSSIVQLRETDAR